MITATATDQFGAEGSDEVEIYATPNGQSFNELFARRALLAAALDAVVIGSDLWIGTTGGVVRASLDLTTIDAFVTVDVGGQNTGFTRGADLDVRNGELVVATNNGLAVGCVAGIGTGVGGTNELLCDEMVQEGDRSLQTDQLTSVVVLADGRMIAGSNSCLTFIDIAGNRDVEVCTDEGGGDRAPFDEVRQLTLDPTTGDVWVAWNTDGGTAFGASIIAPGGDFNQRNNQEFTDVRTGDGLPSNNVRDVAVAPSGDVWFATANGVARLEGGQMTTFDAGDGLPANDARGIAIDVIQIGGTTHEVAWTAMNGGLGRIDAAVPSAIGITSADGGFGSNDLTSVTVLPDHTKAVGLIDGVNTGVFLYSGL